MEENSRVEYKSELNDKLEKSVVEFLNYSKGGEIYIGMDNSGNVLGIEDIDNLQLKIMGRIKNNISPSTLGLFDIIVEEKNKLKYIKIIISSGTEKPYYIKHYGMSESGCYIRVGSSAQPMTRSMIDKAYARRTRNSLKNMISPRDDLKFEQLKIYYQERGFKITDNFLQNLELMIDKDVFNYNGYLLADENGTSIKVAKYLENLYNKYINIS